MLSVDEFANKIKQKYPEYKNVDNQTLAQDMIKKYPQYQSQVDMKQAQGVAQGPVNNLIDNTVGKIPVAGGLMSGVAKTIVDPPLGMAEQGLQEGTSPVGLNLPVGTKTLLGGDLGPNKYMSADAYKGATSNNPVDRALATLGPQVGTLSDVMLPGAVKGAASIPSTISKYGTLARTGKTIANVASKASEEGKAIDWNTVSTEIRKEVIDRLGNTSDVKTALDKLLSEKTPSDLSGLRGKADLSPNDLLKWRQQIVARGAGKGVLQSFMKGSDIEDKVGSIARGKISAQLKQLAPDIKKPDSVYSFYKKMHGDAPTWGKRMVAGVVADQLLGNKLGGTPREIVDLLGAALVGGL